MGPQGLDGCIIARKLCLSQSGVNLVMANLMQTHDRTALATFELGDKVMKALARLGRDRALAERANRHFRQFDLILVQPAGKRMARFGQKARGV